MLVFFAVTAGLTVGVFAGMLALLCELRLTVSVYIVLAFVAVLVAACFYRLQLGRKRFRMQQAIADGFVGERLPMCLRCGYDLRAAESAVCPECGNAVVATSDSQAVGR